LKLRILLAPAVATALSLSLSACVFRINDHGSDDWHDDSYGDVEHTESRNRDVIAGLALGSTIESVRARLGEPDFTDAFTHDDAEIRVLRYRTHRTHADGDTTPDETTALIFVAGKLSGIGETALARAMGQ